MSDQVLPDGSSFFVMEMALPDGHWLHAEGHNEPPMPWRVGTIQRMFLRGPDGEGRWMTREEVVEGLHAAGRYAVRAATMNGTAEMDPDALLQNLVVGLLEYWTADGRDVDPAERDSAGNCPEE